MKVRYGFVSNSSSSNFIVSAKDLSKEKHVAVLKIDLNDYMDVISTIEELDEYYLDNYREIPDISKVGNILRSLDPPSHWQMDRIFSYYKAYNDINRGLQIGLGFFSDNDGDIIPAGLVNGGVGDIFCDVNVIKDCDGY